MKKFIVYILIATGIIILLVFLFFKNNLINTQNNSNISATKLSTNVDYNNLKDEDKEQEIASFSTEIKDNSEGRIININITCSALNNTIINPGESFSFNDIVGKPSSDKGYEEATIIVDGEHEKGIGGR